VAKSTPDMGLLPDKGSKLILAIGFVLGLVVGFAISLLVGFAPAEASETMSGALLFLFSVRYVIAGALIGLFVAIAIKATRP
jgi:hypothetical protein